MGKSKNKSKSKNKNKSISYDKSSLYNAVKINDEIRLVKLLEAGANPNITGNFNIYPLTEASRLRRPNLVSILLEYRANTDIQDNYGNTPLMYASFNEDIDTVNLLLNHGANPNIGIELQECPIIPLTRAILQRNEELLILLLRVTDTDKIKKIVNNIERVYNTVITPTIRRIIEEELRVRESEINYEIRKSLRNRNIEYITAKNIEDSIKRYLYGEKKSIKKKSVKKKLSKKHR